jgi:hypothetical protein
LSRYICQPNHTLVSFALEAVLRGVVTAGRVTFMLGVLPVGRGEV